ncbi:hypothetical protein P7C70_g411, partial [Phenoliferia sp. Uapishka_3]
MGNNNSSHGSSHIRRSRSPSEPVQALTTIVDDGFIEPQSMLYASAAHEYSRPTLILERRLAPFYLGLNDFEPEWDVNQIVTALEEGDRQATRNLREALGAASEAASEAEAAQMSNPAATRKGKEAAAALSLAVMHRERLVELISFKEKRGGGLYWSSKTEQARRYLGAALECPICFLYYPPNLVHTRCCDQPICTECFVQIKRADPTTTHLESEPAACPFCMEPNFGCLYIRETTPPIRAGMQHSNSTSSGLSVPEPDPSPTPKPRRKSFAHTERLVVTTDQIHPDWEAKVEAMKAAVARRANRRIVFRQVGDRLIPVGVTTGREGDGGNATMSTAALPPGFAAQVAAALDTTGNSSGGREGRRAARRRNQEMAQYLESMGVGVGQDLEEMMVMEAMRLSMLEDEERRKKQNAEQSKAAPEDNSAAETSTRGAARLHELPSNEATTSQLSDALSGPMGGVSLLDDSPFMTSAPLPSMPILQPTTRTPTQSRPSSPGIQTGSHHRGPLLSSVAPPDHRPAVVAAHLQLPSIPLSEPLVLPTTSASLQPSDSRENDFNRRNPSPSLISFSTTASSREGPGYAESSDDESSLNPSQGYEALEDDDEADGVEPEGRGGSPLQEAERRTEAIVPRGVLDASV